MTADPFRSNVLTRRAAVLGSATLLAGCRVSEQTVPELRYAPVSGLRSAAGAEVPGIDTALFVGRVTLLNVWASWCPICRSEHDMLKTLATDDRYMLAGLVFRDSAENARTFLEQAGNPFEAVSVDAEGRIARALGVRGVPYTFVVDRNRKAIAQVIGAVTEQNVASVIRPAIQRALEQPAA